MNLLPSTEYIEWQWPLAYMPHHDGKISPGWWCGGVHAQPLSLYLPSSTKLWCTVHSIWEGRYTPPISTLPLYVSTLSPYLKKSLQVKELTENPVWISLSLTVRLYWCWMMIGVTIASPVPRIYGAPRPPQILAHFTPFLALFLWGRDAIGALTVSQTFVGIATNI